MPFQYSPTPESTEGFTTRTILDAEIAEAELVDAIAGQTGLTAEQATAALNGFVDQALLQCAQSRHGKAAGGRLHYRPTSGGNAGDSAAFLTADDIEAGVAISLSAETIGDWRATLAMQNMGEVGPVTPEVHSILSLENGEPDQYTPGALIRIRGENLKFHKADVAEGVFFTPVDGEEVRAAIYGTISGSELIVLVPSALSGPLSVSVSVMIEGSVRTAAYPTPIIVS